MPSNMREINTQKFVTVPNKDSYVFVRVKDDSSSVLVSDGTGEYVAGNAFVFYFPICS